MDPWIRGSTDPRIEAELGSVDPLVLTRKVEGPRVVVLAGRAWTVTYIDWKRRRCFVKPSDSRVRMRWSGGAAPLSFELCRAQRDVLLGEDCEATLSRRAVNGLARLREERGQLASHGGTVVRRDEAVWWWTWAGARANATLVANLNQAVDPDRRYDNVRIRLRADVTAEDVAAAAAAVADVELASPEVSEEAVRGLKFADVLPAGLVRETVALRMADHASARHVLAELRRWSS